MTIIEKSKVRQAYERARALGAGHDAACRTVAQALCLNVETVVTLVREAEEKAA